MPLVWSTVSVSKSTDLEMEMKMNKWTPFEMCDWGKRPNLIKTEQEERQTHWMWNTHRVYSWTISK